MQRITKILLTSLMLLGILGTAGVDARNMRETTTRRVVYQSYDVDREPEFPGGEAAMIKFINKERRYPMDAYRSRQHGRVVCGFVVNPDGRISDVQVVRGANCKSLNDEAVRVVTRMPAWRAGRLKNVAVPVYCLVTIPFRL